MAIACATQFEPCRAVMVSRKSKTRFGQSKKTRKQEGHLTCRKMKLCQAPKRNGCHVKKATTNGTLKFSPEKAVNCHERFIVGATASNTSLAELFAIWDNRNNKTSWYSRSLSHTGSLSQQTTHCLPTWKMQTTFVQNETSTRFNIWNFTT